jgi:hypothetical protein
MIILRVEVPYHKRRFHMLSSFLKLMRTFLVFYRKMILKIMVNIHLARPYLIKHITTVIHEFS